MPINNEPPYPGKVFRIDDPAELVPYIHNTSWKLRVVDYNTFNGKTIIQIWKDDELRGSFTLDTEEEKNDLEWWKSILGEKR